MRLLLTALVFGTLLAGCTCATGGASIRDMGQGGGAQGAQSGRDGGMRADGGLRTDGGAPGALVLPDGGAAPQELCGNHIDDDGDGQVDEDCSCTIGDSRFCFSGAAALAGVGLCHAGVQTCETQDEFGHWGACVGEVLPGAEVCDGLDNDCDGTVDQNLTQACSTQCGAGTQVCSHGFWGTCSARAPSAEVCDGIDNDCNGQIDDGLTRSCSSACGAGTETCSAGAWGSCSARQPTTEVCDGIDNDCDGLIDEGVTRSCASMCGTGTETCTTGVWGGCTARQPTTEICGNGIDENCDGVDDMCVCIHTPGQTAWQIHQGEAPTCWPQTFPSNGNTGEYQYSTIPAQNDSGWAPHNAPNISFSARSTMCGNNGAPDLCACRAGGDFTYFQTVFDIPSGYTVTSLTVNIADVDDGVRVTLFNASHPNGVVGGYAFLGGGSTTDFHQYVVSGPNRIVLTHIDDCCSERRIQNATVSLNGSAVNPCP